MKLMRSTFPALWVAQIDGRGRTAFGFGDTITRAMQDAWFAAEF